MRRGFAGQRRHVNDPARPRVGERGLAVALEHDGPANRAGNWCCGSERALLDGTDDRSKQLAKHRFTGLGGHLGNNNIGCEVHYTCRDLVVSQELDLKTAVLKRGKNT